MTPELLKNLTEKMSAPFCCTNFVEFCPDPPASTIVLDFLRFSKRMHLRRTNRFLYTLDQWISFANHRRHVDLLQ